ncbi:Putative oxidoreductase SadH [Rhodobacteraceae bacterium THAF1]|uniref:SDR family oxidoreductase n=1 Tax=Palleronia sp. THAF1 TaxID=2587842 RepID=UPI000F3ADFE0|nr:SDR family oxidoreductase [Palleronia sp. THAF1]QFU09934.1 Putative oxidoreductase SadH [Palleronia sp. THAF1]VDC17163.1 Putative oxidoreductase SadH [Rhodobacteraceae bacterium THAF1]
MSQKSAIVLGGSAGVGHAVVTALVDRGYRVGVVARGEDRLAEMRDTLGDRIATSSADVGDAAALEAATDTLIAEIGKPTVWVNSAMLTSFSPFEKVEADEFKKIVDTTLHGQANGCRLALRHMDRGNIVNIGSGLGYRSVPFQAAYCAAKHGINGFTSALRCELIRDKRPITLSVVQLPALNTPQFDWAINRLEQKPQPAPPIFQPHVAANAVMKAIDTDAREILVAKSVIQLVFGNFIAPDWLDKKLAKDGAEMQKSGANEPGGRENNLMTPATHAAGAKGSFTDRAEDSAFTMDGDTLRYAIFGGALGVAFILGLLIG